MLKKLFAGLILTTMVHKALPQCVPVDFTVSSTACLNETIPIQNFQSGGNIFEWDFCGQDLEKIPTGTLLFRNLNWDGVTGLKLVLDNGNWFGFVVSGTNNKIFRLDFGVDLENQNPSIVDLGNVGSFLNKPEAIDFIQLDGQWYGLVVNFNEASVIRLSFGSSVQNIPSTTKIIIDPVEAVTLGSSIKVISSPQGVFAFFANRGGSKIVRMNFGVSILNSPSIDQLAFAGLASPRGLSWMKTCAGWSLFFLSTTGSKVHRLDFAQLDLAPLYSTLNTSGDPLSGVISTEIESDFANYHLLISSSSGAIFKILIGPSISNNTVTVTNLTNLGILPNCTAFDLQSTNGFFFGYLIGNNKYVYNLKFKNDCPVENEYRVNEVIQTIAYSGAGTFGISLKGTQLDGSIVYKTSLVNVSSLVPPDITLTSQNVCANHDINFSSQNISGDITDYNWDFGDTNTSMLENPTHQYATEGDYPVSLQVTATNGCNNLAMDTITIYDQPIANFDLPNTGPAPICTNQEYLFANTSTFDLGSNPTWQWEVNGSPVSSDEDLYYTISSAVMQDVKLIASIPGCTTELMQSITTVQEGPTPDFIFNNDCEDTSILFTNTTSGATTGFSWDFGDGNSSLQSDPSNTFVDFGNYEVTLQATNAAGCINSVVKPIQIYSKPITDFSIDLPPFSCAGTASQFNDLTPSPTDSNLSGWAWTFGDPQNGTSTVRHAQYVYQQAGMYDVELEVTTNFGCKESIQKQVTISQSPGVDFQFEAACVGEATQFTDLSESGVTSWQWNINGTASTLQNPTYTFPAPTAYNASLTVTGSNNCIATLIRPVNVPAPPVLDFLVENNCATQTTLFSDNSQYGSDQPSTHSWLFEAGTQALGSSAEHSFASVGTFPTQLTVTSQSGCEYTLTKNVQIVNPPVASFVASAMEGGPPLSVSLINQSLNSVSRQWTVNGPENFSSTQVSPTFILNELGDYTVDLRAQNASGCSDVTSKIISVITPSLDIVLEELTLIQSGANEVSILVTLRNHSNFTTSNLAATVNAGGAALINELISATIPPGEAYTQALKTRIAGTKTTLEFVCVEIIAEGDVNPDNNKKCENLNSEIVTFNPYPNPSTSELNFDWIAATSGSAEVTIFNSNGQSVFQNSIPNFEVGLNSLSIQMPILNAGIYYIVFVSGNTRNSYPFMVQN